MPLDHIRELLLRDPAWSAYALADLDPPNSQFADWQTGPESVVLVYREFDTPIVFALGTPDEVGPMLAGLAFPQLHLQLQPGLLSALPGHYRVVKQRSMWRMRLEGVPSLGDCAVERLTLRHLAEVEALYREGEASGQAPDFFFPSMLEKGVFFGARVDGQLVAVAGTPVVEPRRGVTAIGNVYTHSAFRRRGFSSSVTAALTRELLQLGCATVVLNVEQANTAALPVYEKLGFVRHCGFMEGLADAL